MPIDRRGNVYRVRLRRKGWPEVSIPCHDERTAKELERLLEDLVGQRRRDILAAIANGTLDPVAVRRATITSLPLFTVSVDDLLRHERHETAGLLGAEGDHMLDPSEPTAGELVDEWLRWMALPSTRPRGRRIPFSAETIAGYGDAWRFLFDWLGSRHWPLRRFDATLLAEYRAARVDGGATNATVDRNVTAYASFARWVREQWEPEHHRTLGWASPGFILFTRPSTRAERYVPPQHFETILEVLNQGGQSDLYRSFYRCIRASGTRIDEILWLRRCDVDLPRRLIHIRAYPARRIKSEYADREVPILPQILADWQTIAGDDRYPEQRYLHPLVRNYDHVMGVWRRACIRAGFHDGGAGQRDRERTRIRRECPDISEVDLERRVHDRTKGPLRYLAPTYNLHSLRHSFGVICAQTGLGTKRIAKLMGHASSSTTEIYMEWAFGDEERDDIAIRIGAHL